MEQVRADQPCWLGGEGDRGRERGHSRLSSTWEKGFVERGGEGRGGEGKGREGRGGEGRGGEGRGD